MGRSWGGVSLPNPYARASFLPPSVPDPLLKETNWDRFVEEEILQRREKEDSFRFHAASIKPLYVIDTPPPYPSGPWHIGAEAGYALIDRIARSFLVEITYVSVVGIVTGIALGIFLSYDVYLVSYADLAVWSIPYLRFFPIGVGAYFLTVLSTAAPAVQASRIPPAGALRTFE